MERILVPHDGSESAARALRLACEEFGDRTIVVLHVVEPFPDHTAAGMDLDEDEWPHRAESHSAGVIDDARSIADSHNVEIETEWVYGRPRTAIAKYAATHDIDAIVMGTHGRGAIGRLAFGSVADATVRRSPVPVMIVPEGDRPVDDEE